MTDRDALIKLTEEIQQVKDNHNEKGTSINYGTICSLVIIAHRLLENVEKRLVLCDDVVSRQAVLKQLKSCLTGGETEYQYVKLHIDSVPSVRPQESEPKTWKWIITYPHGEHNPTYECPRCHASNSSVFKNYCPNCGARMFEP